jgi:hypothetical protein
MRWSSALAGVQAFALGSLLLIAAGDAQAYPWMIRHSYTGCSTCHADPSGWGLLTAYGRAQSELVLRTQYSTPTIAPEAGPAANFLFGALDPVFKMPDWLLLGGSFRGAELVTRPQGGSASSRYIQMQADGYAQVTIGHFRANAAIGYSPTGATLAALTRKDSDNIVSRVHWLGFDFGDQAFLLRAGRLNVPFGIRNNEHTAFVRQETRVDLNSGQQHGVALAYTGDRLRGELMGILGNYQLFPDERRERGYSGYLEVAVTPRAALGVSSLITHVKSDRYLRAENTRQAHGIFARYAPVRPVVLLMEADLSLQRPVNGQSSTGYVGFLQIDTEFIQGVHLAPWFEILDERRDGNGPTLGAWFSADWFFAPHTDIRLDFFQYRIPVGPTIQTSLGFLANLHIFL